MRLIVRDVQPSYDDGDHREFDDFRDALVDDFLGDEFAGFWDKLAPPPSVPKAASEVQPEKASWVEVLSLLCVT